MEKITEITKKYLLLTILLLSLPAIRYLFVFGFFGVSDDLHIAWLDQMHRAITMFQFPPRFVPDLSYRFGYPLFTFVYPLPFYVGEAFHLIGFSLVNSIKLVFGLSVPFSIYFMYLFLRRYLPHILSLAGAVLYVYTPYRATEIFVRGSIGEIVSFVFLPLIILSFLNLTEEKKNIKWLGIGAISTALLILSHNIMAYMFMPFLVLLITARIIIVCKNKKLAIIKSLSGLFLGFLISMYFWFPAITESRLMKYDTVFNFYDHFPTIKQLITPFFSYGASVAGPYDTMSFYLGLVNIFIIIIGGILFLLKFKAFKKDEKVFLVWVLFILFISTFMMNHRSKVIWETIPFLPYFQFPWRFLAMVVFVTPFLLIAISKLKYYKHISWLIIITAIILNFGYFKTSEYLGRNDDYYLKRYVPYPNLSEEYKNTSEEYLRLPINSQKRPENIYPRAFVVGNKANLEIEEKNALNAIIKTSSKNSFGLNYSKYYYPGWQVKIDGIKVDIKPGQPYGQITVDVPAGEHEVKIMYKELSKRLILDWISLISFGVGIYFLFKKKK